jgi:hypothetical protein
VLRGPDASWLDGKRISHELRADDDPGQLWFSDSKQDDVLKAL